MDNVNALRSIAEMPINLSVEQIGALQAGIKALQKQAERDKGCEYCNNEKVFGINFGGEKAGIAYLHKCSDGWGLFLEMDNGSTYYTDVVNCPMCGRRLK
ncbi:hypothetical protein FL966_05950 [Caproiciproducens galactitolivorans]|jgi:hypothetical protein|uniref:Uncharacterized protein n=1 Tax=Caproiciproducens galactitolivorans TaxID=642589 RepID=A0A4Z0Y923_9FIRM|nr:hypothetical protein [Caproiciproducens galactitolivorans]QEY34632.1 hypothetical protein FL966_05950 [Caproiciproducens galactitolivorans]TGJ75403.1 hypothetical protein CAGA_24260 [Caproiciproducens galactitolivorans]